MNDLKTEHFIQNTSFEMYSFQNYVLQLKTVIYIARTKFKYHLNNCIVAQWLVLLPHSKKTSLCRVCMFAFAYVSSRQSGFLPQFNSMLHSWIDDSKLSRGADGCVIVALPQNGNMARVYSIFAQQWPGYWLGLLCDPNRVEWVQKMDKRMVGYSFPLTTSVNMSQKRGQLITQSGMYTHQPLY